MRGVLNNRFEVIEELGAGSQGATFLALDQMTNEKVAVKKLAVEKLENWKSLELFERESKVLRNIDHDNIPNYIDSFHLDDEVGRHFYLVQSFVPGKNLEDRFNEGERWDEKRATDLLQSMNKILAYLHGLSPKIIHRDIKPSNIIETDEGEFFLIDFGSVQEKIQSTVGGSTISGTPGFMAMEQLMGRAVAGSDIYGLGSTLVRLMTRRHPTDIELKNGKMDFRNFLTCSERLKDLLEEMTAPIIENRLGNTKRLQERLNDLVTPEAQSQKVQEPELSDKSQGLLKPVLWGSLVVFILGLLAFLTSLDDGSSRPKEIVEISSSTRTFVNGREVNSKTMKSVSAPHTDENVQNAQISFDAAQSQDNDVAIPLLDASLTLLGDNTDSEAKKLRMDVLERLSERYLESADWKNALSSLERLKVGAIQSKDWALVAWCANAQIKVFRETKQKAKAAKALEECVDASKRVRVKSAKSVCNERWKRAN